MKRRQMVSLVLLVAASLMLVTSLAARQARAVATFTVNSTADTGDANPGNGLCETFVGFGQCTLRAAIEEANALDGADVITFALGAGNPVISPGSPLPTITGTLTINGNTGGATRVQLAGVGAGGSGLVLGAGSDGSLIQGLVIHSFSNHGIEIASSLNKIQGNYIGTNSTGTVGLGNAANGVFIINGTNNTIGGIGAVDRNVISGNNGNGIEIFGGGANLIHSNFIGTNAAGTAPLGNSNGVVIDSAFNNSVGAGPLTRNVISGNNGHGVLITGAGAAVNRLVGNYIGTNAAGTAPLGNLLDGVRINNGGGNTIGATTDGGNIISGNNGNGVLITGAGATGNELLGNFIGTNAAGTGPLGNSNGVLIDSAFNTIGGTVSGRGNVISGNINNGILIFGGGATGNLVQGNFIGTNAGGTTDLGNAADGVLINGAPNNTIGGTAAGARNVISGNNLDGIGITGSGATGNQVQGNYIGTNALGTAPLGNAADGVFIFEAPNNTIGGTAAGAGNLISGNNSNGIHIAAGGATSNQVQGNFIGTDSTGTSDLGNDGDGVVISEAPNNTIGGTTAAARNLISGNNFDGIEISHPGATGNQVQGNFIGTNATGTAPLGNTVYGVQIRSSAPNNTIGGTAAGARNVISGNGSDGIEINGGSGNQVQGNFIGTDASGTADLGNGVVGVRIHFAPNNTVGGTAAGAGNVISGNNTSGVVITGGSATGNQVQGNFIGTNAAGTAPLANSNGVLIDSAANNTVGGTTVGAGNVISGNVNRGVFIFGGGATGNQVQGNFIGTNASGTAPLGNGLSGVLIESANNTVGGTAAAARNLISANNAGIEISGGGATGNQVQGNFIGTDSSGTVPLSNRSFGVVISNAANNTVGGTTTDAPNLISGNDLGGVFIFGGTGNQVQGNFIGTDSSGEAPLGNNGDGVRIIAVNNTIGDAAGPGNTIAFNSGSGVWVESGTGNAVLTNSIFSNGSLGLDLGTPGVTANDPGDPDTGANNLQNFPVLTQAFLCNNFSGVFIFITGTLNSTASTTFTLQFFSNPSCDPSGNGEGPSYLGATDVTTDADGNASFNFTAAVAPGGQSLTATATRSVAPRDTSEFSPCIPVTNSLQVTNNNDSGGGSLRQALLDANSCAGVQTITFNIGAGGAQTISPASALPVITDPVIVDGTTQPGFTGAPLIELNGAGAGAGVDGLAISGGGSTVRGLVINRFSGDGIELSNNGSNTIQGCYIGTNASGTAALGNNMGVRIDSGSNNTIGGTTAAARNVISGNNQSGIRISGSGAGGNQVQGNFIGIDSSGTADLGNVFDGVFINNVPNNTIGGTAAGARNVISGNNDKGIIIFGPGATGNQVQGNFIGTDSSGTVDLGNSGQGVIIDSANNTVGGTTAGAGNLISGNNNQGISISGLGATGNQVQGNFIGTSASGTAALGNTDGVFILNAPNNTIGGTTAAARNVISGNNNYGIEILGSNATGNQVQGNYIGTNASGTAVLGNSDDGVHIDNAANNSIGGTAASAGNLISGNTRGIGIFEVGATGNQVQGNYIGTDASGTADLGNSFAGVVINNAPNNTVGGTTVAARNVISGNNVYGIHIGDDGATGNQVQGNFIGTDASGTAPLGNNADGVFIGDVANNTIGGAAGAGNTIAFNNGSGVSIATFGVTSGNAVLTNSIFSNGSLGIDLGTPGVTANDPGDPDTGANNLQNFPVILSANTTGTTITMQASLNSTPQAVFNIDFYANPAADPSGFGEGKTYLGSVLVVTEQSGNTTFSATFTTAVAAGQFITATATDLAGNTSEFSQAFAVSDAGACATLELVPTSASFGDAGGSGLFNITKAAGCTWTAVSNAPWITNVAPASGTGNGPVTYTVAANASGCRSGTITVGGRTFTVYQSCPTEITLVSFKAAAYEAGTLLEWQTGREADNLGFRLYREEAGRRSLVNRELVAGSALRAGAPLGAGEAYAFWDAAPGQAAAYWLEAIDLNCQSTWHGPVAVNQVGGQPPALSPAELLSRLGRSPSQDGTTRVVEAAPPSAGSLARATAEARLAHAALDRQSAVKMVVRRAGLYRVTQAELVAAGFDPNAPADKLQLFVDGVEQPLLVAAGKNGRFDEESFIEFYGLGLDTPSTDARVYWIAVGEQAGKRIPQVAAQGGASSASSFLQTVERRDKTLYFAALRNGEAENFFGTVVTPSGVEQTLAIRHLEADFREPATLEVALQGVTQLTHRASVQVNGALVGYVHFSGQAKGVERFPVPHALLREGENIIALQAMNGASDVSLVEAIRLTYAHTLTADDDALRFTAAGGENITVIGFTAKSIRVFDVTDGGNVKELLGEINPAPGGYSITVAAADKGERILLALTEPRIQKPAAIEEELKSRWRSEANAADLVMLTRREFLSVLGPLAEARRKEGYHVEMIDLADLYDEFAFGHKTPAAIREFFAYAATHWRVAPRFVLLAGDASYDARNYLGLGEWDLVPTKLIDTDFLETASDDWFADFNDDGISDIAVGRLPARTAAELDTLVKKLLSFEQSPPSREALLVADRNDGFDFELASQNLRSLLPEEITVEEIFRSRVDDAIAQESIRQALRRGPSLVNYMGHGSVNVWRGGLLTTNEARSLESERLSLFVLMTCLNGHYQDAAMDSLGEALLKAERGGAVAVWASSGLTYPHEQAQMTRALYQVLFAEGSGSGRDSNPPMTLGEAVRRAKAAVSDGDVRRTWILLGDPTVRLSP